MLAHELFDQIQDRLKNLKPEFEMPLLQREMLMECCENAIANSDDGEYKDEVLILSSLQAFEVCQNLIRGMVKGLVPAQADTIILNYRGHTFILDDLSV